MLLKNKELLANAVEKLLQIRIRTAQLDAEVLLMYVLGNSRAWLYARLDETPEADLQATFFELVNRRVQGEPIAYIVNHREFMALDFYVDRRVLIPRPETEHLVELTVKTMLQLGWEDKIVTLADIGTGSGVIAIYLALRFPSARVYATDISQDALDVARLNARRHEVHHRIEFVQGNLLEPLPEPINGLISNPPYTVISQVEPNVARYEPNIALDGGPKGLSIYRELLRQARQQVTAPGFMALEIGSEQAADVSNLGRFFLPNSSIEIHKDYAGLDRVVLMLLKSQ